MYIHKIFYYIDNILFHSEAVFNMRL